MSDPRPDKLPRHIEQTVDAALRTSAETLKKLQDEKPASFPKSTGEIPMVTKSDDDFDEDPTKEFVPGSNLNAVLGGTPPKQIRPRDTDWKDPTAVDELFGKKTDTN